MGLMKKLTSAIVASSLVFSLASAAFAAYTPAAGEEAGTRMQKLGIIQGRPEGLALNSEITRAELVTVIVRAFGKEEDAKLLKGSTIFPDIQNHWASGNIAMAVALVEKAGSDPIGMPDGKFAPDAKLTPAQAVAFLMKFLGQKADGGKTWPANYLDVAVTKGLITADDKALITPMLNENATRGLVFYMFDRAFISYQLPTGKTFYTQYVDTVKPVVTLDDVVANTTDSKLTVTGKSDTAELYVGTTAVTVTNGSFSATVDLAMGENTITVTGKDIAGNATEVTKKVTRTTGVAATITADATIELAAGETKALAVSVKDKDGNVIAGAPVALTGEGTYADGKYTAPVKAGEYALVFKSGELTANVTAKVAAAKLEKITIEGGATTFAVGTTQTFTAKGADVNGNEVALTNVTWTATGGVVNNAGQFVASTSGAVTITATANGISGTLAATAFGKATALKLSTPANIVANGSSTTTVTATAVDANGNVDLSFTGSATFSSNNITIAKIDGSATANFVNGVATATLKSAATSTSAGVGASTVSVSVTGMNAATSVVTADRQVLTSIATSADPGTIAADGASTSTIKVKMLDQAGAGMLNAPSLSFTATAGNTAIAGISGITDTRGAYSSTAPWHYTYTVTSAGDKGAATFSFTVTTDAYKSIAVPAVTVNADTVGAAYKLGIDTVADKVAGKAASVVVRVFDYSGNQLTGDAGRTITLKDTTSNITLPTVNTTAGKATFSLTRTAAKTYNLEATAGTLVKATGSVVYTPADAAALDLTATPDVLNANGTAQGTLKATVVDAYGNKVTTGTYNVKFSKTVADDPKATQDFTDTTVATVDGVATATITASLNNNRTDTYKVTATGLVEKTVQITSKIMGAPAKLAVDTVNTTSTAKTVGSNAKVTIAVQDSLSTVVSTEQNRVVTLTVKDGDAVEVQTLTASTVNGKATFEFTQTTSGAYSYVATSEGVTKVSSATDLTFNAGTATALKVTPALTTIGANASVTDLKVVLVDQYGNKTAGTGVTVNYSVNNTTVGNVSAATSGSQNFTTAGYSAVTFTSTSVPGVATVTVTDAAGTLTSATANITTITVGAAVRATLAVEGTPVISGAAALPAVRDYSVVAATAVDASGNRVTNNTSTVRLTITKTDGTTPNMAKVKVYASTAAATAETADAGTNGFDLTMVAGQVKFYVTHETAETLNYSAVVGTFAAVTGSATFNAAPIASIAFETPVDAYLLGNGTDVTILKIVAKDGAAGAGNTVANATGTVYFKLSVGNDYATLLNTSAPFVNGEAIVSIQSKVATDNATITVKAWTDAKDGDGVALTAKDETSAISNSSIVVDGKVPSTAGATITVGGNADAAVLTTRTNDTTPTFVVEDPADAVGIAKVALQYKTPSTTVWTTINEDTDGADDYTVAWGTTILSDGTYDFRAVAYDAAGNSKTSSTFKLTVDTVAPAVAGLVSADNDTTVGVDGRDITLNWTATADTTFASYKVYVLPTATALNTTTHTALLTSATITTATWSGVVGTQTSAGAAFAAGSYTAYVVVTDDLGNTAVHSVTFTLAADPA